MSLHVCLWMHESVSMHTGDFRGHCTGSDTHSLLQNDTGNLMDAHAQAGHSVHTLPALKLTISTDRKTKLGSKRMFLTQRQRGGAETETFKAGFQCRNCKKK